ncbi:hypothetical protein [Streptosporangium sp. CA-115845]|uniref:hypothetical protein n=1 Tax=Streptosporangium sp. CA-115845 TaxID=3240071 RepID=UPI003D928074
MTNPALVVLRPGDKVLITLEDDPPDDVIAHVTSGLRRDFPGVHFTVVTAVSGIAVLPPT